MEGFTKFLKIADPIDVMIFKENDESITLPAFVYDVVNDERMILSHPIHQGQLFMLTRNSQYYFRFFIENLGMFLFKGTVEGRINYDNLPSIIVTLASEIKKVQRRKFFRVHFLSSGYLQYEKPLSEEDVSKRKAVLEKKFKTQNDILVEEVEVVKEKFETLDLSGGGIRIVSKNQHEIGEEVKGAFKISSVWVDFKGEVLRVDKNDNGSFNIGIKFLELDSATQSRIVSYVFEIERNLIKKGLM